MPIQIWSAGLLPNFRAVSFREHSEFEIPMAIFKPTPYIDRRTHHRQAIREMDSVSILSECNCTRAHASYISFAKCALGNGTLLSSYAGEVLVAQFCDDTPKFSLFRSLAEGAKAYETRNAFGCSATTCHGFHELRILVIR